jgi:hypothetical protein
VLIGSGLLQVREDFGDDLRLLDAGNDPEPDGAPGAALEQLNATSFSEWQSSQRRRRKPSSKRPHFRYASNSCSM